MWTRALGGAELTLQTGLKSPRGATDISLGVTIALAQTSKRKRGSMNLFVLKTWLETKLHKDEDGASLVEYILLVALIALAVIAAVIFLRNQVSDKFNDAGSRLSTGN